MRNNGQLAAISMRMPTPNEIASLAKADNVRWVLAALAGRFGHDSFQIIDDWEADLCAVGIARPDDPNKVAYISTYGLPEGQYACHIDIWPSEGSDGGYKNIAQLERVGFATLVTAITEYLGIEARPAR